jgi:hypothetical protein
MRVDEINRPGVRTTLAADADNDTSTGRHSIHQSRITGLRIDELSTGWAIHRQVKPQAFSISPSTI